MESYKIRKGLNLPISGEPDQTIYDGPSVSTIALVAADYMGMKPTMFVNEGDSVQRGQVLFEDKKSPGILYTASGAGTVKAVNRGEKRALKSVVIALSEEEKSGDADQVSFENYSGKDIAILSQDEIRALLIESGLWTAFRTRPFSKVPRVDSVPDSIFITAMDTHPLAPDVDVLYKENPDAFERGLATIAKLREGHIYLCVKEESAVNAGPYSGILVKKFSGPHPAGTVGMHIHSVEPVHGERTAWHIGLQDVMAIGKLFGTGQLDVSRVVSLAGPSVSNPRLIRTRMGASIDELTAGELSDDENRIISGSVLSGRIAMGDETGYLGRYSQQVSVLPEGREREFLGWMGPGKNKFSVINTFVSKLTPHKKFSFSTTTNGSQRAMVPIGMYEQVMPMDLMPTHLLRALIVGDVERAERLGCLELDEEDLALCTFVCPGKYEYGPYLRQVLTQIELEN